MTTTLDRRANARTRLILSPHASRAVDYLCTAPFVRPSITVTLSLRRLGNSVGLGAVAPTARPTRARTPRLGKQCDLNCRSAHEAASYAAAASKSLPR